MNVEEFPVVVSTECSEQQSSVLRLDVTADADAGAIIRVLERFQNLNAVPKRVIAECSANGVMRIQMDLIGVPEHTLSLVAAKVAQLVCVRDAFWYRP